MHRARLPLGLGLGRVPAVADACMARRCRPDCVSPSACPSRCSPRPPRPPPATTRTSPSTPPSTAVGPELAEEARRISLAAYRQGAELAAARGIIIADTKFELGLIDGRLAICDEILTPDSSRFWPADQWEPGRTPPAFDKQPLRDWLEETGWDKTPPPPALPAGRGPGHSRSICAGLRAPDRAGLFGVARGHPRA